MTFSLLELDATRVVEGTPGEPFLTEADDGKRVLDECAFHQADAALLYADNLPADFFDSSSRRAGTILQKLRNYRVRLAVVCEPGSVTFSSRFGEMVAEARRGQDFGLFHSRQTAIDWLRPEA